MIFSRLLFNVALGVTDGLLTALVLTAGVFLRHASNDTFGLVRALQIASAAAIPGVFTVFVSDYSRLREDLSHAARELNLESVHRLLASNLVSKLRAEAIIAGFTTAIFSFLGAMVPLGAAALWPSNWTALLASAATLVITGAIIGRIVGGRSLIWALLLVIGGGAVTMAGIYLDVMR